jgi:DNA-binding NtrC family response regulator
VGDETTIKIDVRIIAATNKDLRQEAIVGNFRRDLYYRLYVVPINLPPLRQRKTDIPLLAEHFLKRAATEAKREDLFLANKALAAMMEYHWPGNVRELQSAIRYALVKCEGNIINSSHLPDAIFSGTEAMPQQRRRRRKLNLYSVQSALRETNRNKAKAAQLLGVSRSTLYRFLAENVDAD